VGPVFYRDKILEERPASRRADVFIACDQRRQLQYRLAPAIAK